MSARGRRLRALAPAAWLSVSLLAGCGEEKASEPASATHAAPEKKPSTPAFGSAAPPFDAPPATATAPIPPPRVGPKKRRASVKAASAQAASGRLTLAQVEEAIDANLDALSSCTSDEVVITMKALVGANGKVIEASATRSSPDDPRVRDCVATAFKKISFPASSGGAPAPLSFDLSLGAL